MLSKGAGGDDLDSVSGDSSTNGDPPPSSPGNRKGRTSASPPSSPRRSLSQTSGTTSGSASKSPGRKVRGLRRAHSMSESGDEEVDLDAAVPAGKASPGDKGRGRERPSIMQRLRDRSRSRSRSKSRSRRSAEERKEMLVAVTSCRSDGYYNQKAPGSTFKLPRKAPTNLKLFHELAVGVKDAYAAVGATPRKPTDEEAKQLSQEEVNGRMVLWDFIGNLDFVSNKTMLPPDAYS
jgi:hypothetical protein